MPSTLKTLVDRKLTKGMTFSWMPENICFETIMGSVAYGVSNDTSDMDVYGFCIPPKPFLFPHLAGEIEGFGQKAPRFEQYQEHHIMDNDALGGKGRSYDVTIYSISKYFKLVMENNPNMIDSLFTPENCVLHITPIGSMVRERRREFLHKGCWHKFKGYAFEQMHKMDTKNPEEGSKRAALREQFGFDVKFAYHVVRLINEVEQILATGDLNLQLNNDQLKAIRRGEMNVQQIRDWFNNKLKDLESLYHSSTLPYAPNEAKIKRLLLECLEMHYGSLEKAVVLPDAANQTLAEIKAILDRHTKNQK